MNKKILYTVIAGALVATGFTSCNNDEYLEVTHYNILGSGTMYESDENADAALMACYDMVLPSGYSGHNGDPYKPYIFTGLHPTMDTQATGWDKSFMTQSWTADESNLLNGWRHAYAAISRANDFLAGLPSGKGSMSDAAMKSFEGEARALRAYQYFWLATTFGRVPMLATGENYSNTPSKAAAGTYKEMWQFIIDDLTEAAKLLEWDPYNKEYGRCTKGMALAYLGDAYMWLAYRENDPSYYETAKAKFKEIIDSKTYELQASYTTLWDADEAWGKEAIWQQVLNEGDQWGGWDGSKWSEAHGWVGFYCGAPANGAWGTMALSWELYDAFEDNDKRRDGSLVTAAIPASELERVGKERWAQKFVRIDEFMDDEANEKYIGTAKPFVSSSNAGEYKLDPDMPIGFNAFNQEVVFYNTFHRDASEPAPTVYSTKHWRNGRGTHWSGDQWLPAHVYMKRYANVLLDYAECCFRTGDEGEGWKRVNEIRERAFGNKEVGKSESLTTKFNVYFKHLGEFYTDKTADSGFGKYITKDQYPYIFSEESVVVPDAKDYYTRLKSAKGFTSEVWKVAVNEERRKEFNAEWCVRCDLQKSGYLVDHIEHNYPMGYGYEKGDEQLKEWRTYRNFKFNLDKMDMPIPKDELVKNPLLKQNPAYISQETDTEE